MAPSCAKKYIMSSLIAMASAGGVAERWYEVSAA
jgi:hypothetical protein